jgi:hypothetical protein
MMKAAALGGAAIAAGAVSASASAAPKAGSPKLIHQVFFWLKNKESKADRGQLIAGLHALAKIETVRSLHVGVPANTEQRGVVDGSFDVSETMGFDSVADEKIYQDHPLHQEFIAKHSHLWSKVLVYDVLTV